MSHEAHVRRIAKALAISEKQVQATAALLEKGGTVPFIARYRKEATGALDEVAITTIRDRLTQLAELDKRREAILKSIEEQGKLTDELKEKIAAAETLAELEDIYLPFRPKRRTRATIAREKGSNRLLKSYSSRATWTRLRRRRVSSVKRRAWNRSRRPSPARATLSPSG